MTLPPSHPSRVLPWRGFVLFTAILACLTPRIQAGVRPDYFAADAFGRTLQQDFQKRHSAALIERLDSTAMMRRVLAPFGADILTDPRAKDMWDQHSFPQIVAQLSVFDEHFTLVFGRVALLDDARWLECVLLANDGIFRLMCFRLVALADGTIHIDDFRSGGSPLEASRSLRQTLILLGMRPSGSLEEEELLLCDLSANYPRLFTIIFEAFGERRYDDAFARLLGTPEKLQRTRIWRELRNRLVLLGCVPATKHLEEALRAGEPVDPFFRYALLSRRADKSGSLTAFDEVLRENRDLAYLRCVRAELLLENHRPAEAFDAARAVYEANPLTGSAYSIAVQAAAVGNRWEDAMDSLRAWATLVPAEKIDTLLRAEPTLAPFLASPSYTTWKQQAMASLPPKEPAKTSTP